MTNQELIAWAKTQCNKYANGQCTTARCMRRGGFSSGSCPDFQLATCEYHEVVKALAAHQWQPIETATLVPKQEIEVMWWDDGQDDIALVILRQTLDAWDPEKKRGLMSDQGTTVSHASAASGLAIGAFPRCRRRSHEYA